MCVLPFGHNLNALILFQNVLKGSFHSSYCLATRDLPAYAEQGLSVQRVLSYPYAGFVPRAPQKQSGKAAPKSSRRDYSALMSKWIRRTFYSELDALAGYDLMRHRIRRDWRRVLSRFAISGSDVIFFPSADYYGCVSLLDVVQSVPSSQRPKVHIRLIGVTENSRYSGSPARPEFFRTIRKAIGSGIRVTLSAETITYARYVERFLGTRVSYFPYPLANPQQPIHWREEKVIASPGQGRGDKGFFRLFSILSRVQQFAPHQKFHFDIQNMRESDEEFRARYVSILKNLPNVRLRPARLRQDEIDAVYTESDILLLPYDADTYALRGSAVYQEGVAIGRPVICSVGMGQSDLIVRYGNGLLATSDDEFAHKIIEFSSRSREEVEQLVTRARAAYERDFEAGLQEILPELLP